MFKITNLNKKIGEKVILHDVNLEIAKGEIGIFLGGSGVGKSTLLRILNNLESYDSGLFTLDNKPLDISEVNKNHTVGMVFQHFNLFENLNVEENITLALLHQKKLPPQQADEICSALLKDYGLYDHRHQSVQKLSGGQKQRLAIARTAALNPQITCLDEPTSALDPRLTEQVAKYMTKLAKEGTIVLLTTHDTGLVQQLNGKIFLLQGGTIVETCRTEDFRSQPDSFPGLRKFLGQRQ